MSPLISVLTVVPISIIYGLELQMFFILWVAATLGTIFWWVIQTILFSYFKKKNYTNWQYGITLTLITILFVFVSSTAVTRVATSLVTYSLIGFDLY